MDRLNYQASAWLEQHQSKVKLQEPDTQGALALDAAKARARRLVTQLAPLFPNIAIQTKSEPGLDLWIDSWARQILGAELSDRELLHGLKTVATVLVTHGSPPLSFAHFLEACRPSCGVGGEPPRPRPVDEVMPKLRQDLLKNKDWCGQRDRALAKLRGMGY